MTGRSTGIFRTGTVLAMVIFGFLAFIALLYFIGAGETGRRGNDGGSHAASNALNGYSGFVRLLEGEGMNVNISRRRDGLETNRLLILTPPMHIDAEEFSEILEKRQYVGPTMVILPKWYAMKFPKRLPDALKGKVKDGWVRLIGTAEQEWTADLPEPYAFESTQRDNGKQPLAWSGWEYSGTLPEKTSNAAVANMGQDVLVEDSDGGALALAIIGKEDSEFYRNAHIVIFVVEPDLINNYGMADPARAALALELVHNASYHHAPNYDIPGVTFDVTLNGLGRSANLLTLAFRPPFLAATLCLILALFIIGWRTFRRFGPAMAEGPAIAFGKHRLIANGAGLVLRAKRLRLLTEPYIALTERRLKTRLGIARGDTQAIDQSLAKRLPDTPSFSDRAEALRTAHRPVEILRAAQALKELEGKVKKWVKPAP